MHGDSGHSPSPRSRPGLGLEVGVAAWALGLDCYFEMTFTKSICVFY